MLEAGSHYYTFVAQGNRFIDRNVEVLLSLCGDFLRETFIEVDIMDCASSWQGRLVVFPEHHSFLELDGVLEATREAHRRQSLV